MFFLRCFSPPHHVRGKALSHFIALATSINSNFTCAASSPLLLCSRRERLACATTGPGRRKMPCCSRGFAAASHLSPTLASQPACCHHWRELRHPVVLVEKEQVVVHVEPLGKDSLPPSGCAGQSKGKEADAHLLFIQEETQRT